MLKVFGVKLRVVGRAGFAERVVALLAGHPGVLGTVQLALEVRRVLMEPCAVLHRRPCPCAWRHAQNSLLSGDPPVLGRMADPRATFRGLGAYTYIGAYFEPGSDRRILGKANDPSLETLLAATGMGDEEAFGRLYTATSRQIFAVILRIVARRDWAEDVLQEVFLTIWDHAADYRPDKGAPMAWLTTIGRNRALDRHRKKRREVPLNAIEGSENWASDEPSPLDWAMVSAESSRLKRCLEKLDERQRLCILMALVEGYTYSELSIRFDSPLGTIKSWVRRGLHRLRVCLEQ